jgi:hypothetical protein
MMRPFALGITADDVAFAAGHLRIVISLLFGTRSAGAAERKSKDSHFFCYNQSTYHA